MKLNKFRHIHGTLKRTLKNKTREETQIKFDKMMAMPMVLNQKVLTDAEIVYPQSFKGCTRLDCFYTENIRQKRNVGSIVENINNYRKRWGVQLLRLDGSRIPKFAFKYNPTSRRDVGHPRKRWTL